VDFSTLLLSLVPLFVAVDAVGILPIFLSLTEGMAEAQRRRIAMQAILTAFAVGVGFLVLGRAILSLLGITVQDFLIAGGSVLFLIAAMDLISGRKLARRVEAVGVVPLGVPLIAGPAVLTTELVLLNLYGYPPVLVSLVLCIGFTGVLFVGSGFFIRLLGRAGAQALSKVASLLLAAIAVRMIRQGVVEIVQGFVERAS